MRAVGLVALGASGCFVGYPGLPPDGDDSGLADPPCDAASIEPDGADLPTEVSQIGAALQTVRTFCGRVDRASNDGQSYTGDLDVAFVHTLEPGRLVLVLSWDDGRTDLDVLLNTDGEQWTLGDDGVVEEQLPAGVYTVLVAGTDGPGTDYRLDVWVE